MTEDAARQRLAAQWPTEQKAARADFVMNTDGTFEETQRAGRARSIELATSELQVLACRRYLAYPAYLPYLHPPALRSDFHLGAVLRRRDALFDERVPVVAVRALPEQLRAAVAAAHADVRIEIEDRVLGQLAVAIDERRRVVELAERAPDRLVDAERVRVLHERGEQQVERLARLAAAGQMPRQRETRAPVLRVLFDQAAAQAREAIGVAGADRERLEPIEREIGAVGRDLDRPSPRSPPRRARCPSATRTSPRFR